MKSLLLLLGLLAAPAFAETDTAMDLERKRLDAVVRELDRDARVEAAFASAREVMQEGPVKVRLSDQAVLALAKGYLFVPSAEAAAILRVWGSRPGPDLLGMVLPGGEKAANWFVVLHFNPAGYVRDDDAKKWNPDALLETLKQGANPASGAQGADVQVLGWIEAPRYDPASRQLVWSLAARDASNAAQRSANYNTYSFGREGYVSMNLVADAREIEKYKPAVRELLAGLTFRDGKRYDDFNATTDKVAPHGLTVLVAGAASPRERAHSGAPAASERPWTVPAAIGAGALLAGGLGIWLVRRRRRKNAQNVYQPLPEAPPDAPSERPKIHKIG